MSKDSKPNQPELEDPEEMAKSPQAVKNEACPIVDTEEVNDGVVKKVEDMEKMNKPESLTNGEEKVKQTDEDTMDEPSGDLDLKAVGFSEAAEAEERRRRFQAAEAEEKRRRFQAAGAGEKRRLFQAAEAEEKRRRFQDEEAYIRRRLFLDAEERRKLFEAAEAEEKRRLFEAAEAEERSSLFQAAEAEERSRLFEDAEERRKLFEAAEAEERRKLFEAAEAEERRRLFEEISSFRNELSTLQQSITDRMNSRERRVDKAIEEIRKMLHTLLRRDTPHSPPRTSPRMPYTEQARRLEAEVQQESPTDPDNGFREETVNTFTKDV